MKKILMFGTDWCPHCVDAKPKFNKLKGKFKNAEFEFINCETNPEIEAQFNIEAYPSYYLVDEENGIRKELKGIEDIKAHLRF